MGELVRYQCPAQNFQSLTAGRGFEGAVIDVRDELRGDQDVQAEPEPAEPPQATKHEVGQINVLAGDTVVLHEGA